MEFLKTEQIKNIQGGYKQNDQDYSDNRMHGESVEIYKFFLSKLEPTCERLFQYPLNSFQITSSVWYAKKPIGKNTLAQMMPRISEKSGLSQIYTCHSVRSSCITILFQAGVSAEKIASITRHKNTSSLKHYIAGMSSEQKEECSTILTASLFDQPTSRPMNNDPGSSVAIVPRTERSVQPQNQEVAGEFSAAAVIATAESSVRISSLSSGSVGIVASSNTSGMIAKYSELFGNCTFNSCEIKFNWSPD